MYKVKINGHLIKVDDEYFLHCDEKDCEANWKVIKNELPDGDAKNIETGKTFLDILVHFMLHS